MRKRIGQYNIQRPDSPIGHGQSAAVYLATHIDSPQEVVALKFFHIFEPEKSVQATFLRETKIITRLKHPNIIRVLHVGFDKNNPYYVMNYARSGNLRNKMTRGSRISPEEACVYLQQIADAIQHVHDNGLVHCDLKPENILIAADETLLLADFGITRNIQTIQAQSTQAAAGTPLYMAPEQFLGKPCVASDQYALGVMVYEWLAGVTPFTGNSAVELMGPHLHDDPPPLIDQNPATSRTLQMVIFKALQKKPEDRFPSILEFARVFHSAIYEPDRFFSTAPESEPTRRSSSITMHISSELLPILKAKALGVRLREQRIKQYLSQRDVAEMIGVDPVTISHWERGKSIPRTHNRRRLAELLKMSTEELGF